MELLLQAGANIEAKNTDGYTPLNFAISTSREREAIFLVLNNASCASFVHGDAAVHLAAKWRMNEVQLFLSLEKTTKQSCKCWIQSQILSFNLRSTFLQ